MRKGVGMLAELRNGTYRWKLNSSDKDYMGSFELYEMAFNQFSNDPVVELWSFGIYGQFRGKGYGQQMLKEVIELTRNKQLMLDVYKDNDIAIHVYKKAGFKVVGDYGKYAWAMTYVGGQ